MLMKIGIVAALVLTGLFLYHATEAEGDSFITPTTVVIGDATCDNEVNVFDALEILRSTAGLSPLGGTECPYVGTQIPTVAGFPSCQEDEYIYYNDFPHIEKGLICVHVDTINTQISCPDDGFTWFVVPNQPVNNAMFCWGN